MLNEQNNSTLESKIEEEKEGEDIDVIEEFELLSNN